MRTKKQLCRLTIFKILHKFYKETFYKRNGDEVSEEEINKLYPKQNYEIFRSYPADFWEKYQIEYDEDRDVENIAILLPIFQKVIEENKDKFNKIIFTNDVQEDGYISKYCIVGERLETDQEYKERIDAIENDRIKLEQEKLVKKEQAKQRQIEKAKKYLEKHGAV